METLEALGMPVFYIEPRSVEDVAHTIERLARLAGTEPTGRQAASEFRDGMAALTARYLYENLNPGENRENMDVIYSGAKSVERVVGRFAPRANPEYKLRADESELDMVVATDVLAEGLNL